MCRIIRTIHDLEVVFNSVFAIFIWIYENYNWWIFELFGFTTISLYKNDKLEILQTVIDEIGNSELNSPLKIIIETWQYPLNQDAIDIASLHPDAQITTEAIIEMKIG
jgi:hypothetical protein